jgi:hypothetical protein
MFARLTFQPRRRRHYVPPKSHYTSTRLNIGHNPIRQFIYLFSGYVTARWNAVAYLVEALCYKPEGRGLESLGSGFFFFNLPNPSSRTMVLGSTQPLTEMNTRNLPGGVNGDRRVRLTTLPPSVSRLSKENVGPSTSQNPMGLRGLLQG